MMKPISLIKKMTLFLVFTLMLVSAAGFAQEKVVAIVNNDIITQKDLNDFLNFARVQLSAESKGKNLEDKAQEMKLNLLDRLIEDRLILQDAKRTLEDASKKKDMYTVSRLDIDPERIKMRIGEIRKKFNSEADYQRSLKLQGLVQADLETRMREQLLMYNIIDLKIKSKIMITPAEITDFYEKHKDEFVRPEEREFESLVIEDEDMAKKMYSDLKRGRSFNEMVQQYSMQANSLTATKGELMKEVEDIVFGLSPDEVSKPLKIENAFSIFRLVKIIPPSKQSLEEVQDTIQNYLFEKEMQETLTKWLNELKAQSYIKISPN
ncbi:MAG: peptidyl-prolyl cis-trans isomerase [Candidatus Omnitrophica bacterium]|nr:peptidyl-prolyl cis-trans isomerase [Candidatus Omnitrophota bacterium]